jgi:hypothetical protein
VTWNQEQIALLRRLVTRGRSENEIGRELGITRQAVDYKIRKEGFARLRPVFMQRRALPPLVTAPPLKPTAALSLKVRMLDAADNQCRWISEPNGAETCVCGRRVFYRSWCRHHHSIGRVRRLRPAYA